VHKGANDEAATLPEFPSESDRVELGVAPPRRFVAAPMKGTVMAAAEWGRVLKERLMKYCLYF
jgi:hypothetical protein